MAGEPGPGTGRGQPWPVARHNPRHPPADRAPAGVACGAVVLLLLGAANRRLMLTGRDLARERAPSPAAGSRSCPSTSPSPPLRPPGRPRLSNPTAPGAADTSVGDRREALLAPHPQPRRNLLVAITVLVVAGGVAAATTATTTEHRFEVARQSYHPGRTRPRPRPGRSWLAW